MTDFRSAEAEPDAGLASPGSSVSQTAVGGKSAAGRRSPGCDGAMTAGTVGADRFRRVLSRTIELMNEQVDRAQLLSLADASAVIGWEFPDVAWNTWLVVDREPPRIGLRPEATGPSSLTVIMNSTVLAAAAAGKTSLGLAFITGKLQIRGMNPLFLAKFVKLVDPLLNGYRTAVEELNECVA